MAGRGEDGEAATPGQGNTPVSARIVAARAGPGFVPVRFHQPAAGEPDGETGLPDVDGDLSMSRFTLRMYLRAASIGGEPGPSPINSPPMK